MVHVKTSIGFEMDIDANLFDDMELFDLIAQVEGGKLIALPSVVEKIVGDKKPELYDLLRNDKGRVPTGQVRDQILEIIKQAGGKNS